MPDPGSKEANTSESPEERGIIEEVLPKSLYRVRLESGRTVRAGLEARARHGIVRLLSGDTVFVRLTDHDPHRARITRKL